MESSEQTFGFNRSDANELVRMIGMVHREHLDPRPRQRRGNSGSSGSMIEFEFDDDDYSPGVPADCASRTSGEYNLRVKVVTPPCNGSVLGMDEEGYVTVSDPGEFLKDRDPADLPGRRGFAMLLSGEPEYEYGDATCVWVITWINFFRQISMIHNIIFREMGITIKRKKITVWDECDLPDEEIEGVDCEDEEYV